MTKNNHIINYKTMKTKTYTMIVLLAFSASVLCAGGIKRYTIKSESNKVETTIDLEKLAPSAPLFAEFNDGTEFKASPEVLISNLAPATPKEADFDDATLPVQISTEQLAPASPKEPDFEDIAVDLSGISGILAPSTPSEADFTD
jgi:hypothetical protein